ncbi:MAG: alpha/beta fold hydrolase [Candidatus Sifarchaeia archaeon]
MINDGEVNLVYHITHGKQIIKLPNNSRIDLLVRGGGNPVLWLHSGFRGRVGIENLVSSIERKLKQSDKEWLHLIPNLPGFGESSQTISKNNNPYELTANIEELVNLLDYPRIDVIGFSLGANIASILVNSIPKRFRRVVLLGTAIEGRNLEVYRQLLNLYYKRDWDGIVNEIAERLVGSRNRSQYIKMMPLVKKQVSSESFSRDLVRILSSGVRHDIFEELKKMSHTALMISGTDDPFAPTPTRAQVLERKNNIKFILIDGIGHNEIVFPRQIDLSDQIIEFLEG